MVRKWFSLWYEMTEMTIIRHSSQLRLIPYLQGEKRIHPKFADCIIRFTDPDVKWQTVHMVKKKRKMFWPIKVLKTPKLLRNTQFPSSRSTASHYTDMPMHTISFGCSSFRPYYQFGHNRFGHTTSSKWELDMLSKTK